MADKADTVNSRGREMDAGVKAFVALILAVAAGLCRTGGELLGVALYLVIITVWLRSDLKFIKKNLAAFSLVFILPYSLGLLLAVLAGRLFPGTVYAPYLSVQVTLFKMIKLFFIWYIGSLYFVTTPFAEITRLLNQVLRPLDAIGVPVAKHLHMVDFIITQLTHTAQLFQTDTMAAARRLLHDSESNLKGRLGRLAHMLAGFIADSLQMQEQVEAQMEQSKVQLDRYQMSISRNEAWALLSVLIFVGILVSVAQGVVSLSAAGPKW